MKWPWAAARVINASPKYWPKKVYFLDGPMKGKTAEVKGGLFISIPVNTNDGMQYLRYKWETIYPRALVAYARFLPSSWEVKLHTREEVEGLIVDYAEVKKRMRGAQSTYLYDEDQ